jgi:glycosyltransferase involved in cell wall biosynthesis
MPAQSSGLDMKISLVVPCYNEECVITDTIKVLSDLLRACLAEGLISSGSEILIVDDGSRDKSWELICRAAKSHEAGDPLIVKGLRLSRNRGHQNALLAGLAAAQGDFVVTIDADLQDDLQAVQAMLEHARQGADIVYGVKSAREADSFFKRATAQFFYKLMRLFGVELVFNHADFRGMSSRAVQAMLQYQEVNLFLRGLVPQLGFKSALVFSELRRREAGETKYTLRKMLSFAWQGITSFSTFPLKMMTFIGLLITLPAFAHILWALYQHYFSSATVPGWTSTVVPLMFFSGLQFLALGVIGEYLGKIYLETKRRPRYFIAETIGPEKEKKGAIDA